MSDERLDHCDKPAGLQGLRRPRIVQIPTSAVIFFDGFYAAKRFIGPSRNQARTKRPIGREGAPRESAYGRFFPGSENVDGPTRKEAEMHFDQKQEVRVHIRWMIRRDMPEVLAIERESFEFPWFEEDFIRCLRQRNCIGMVAEYEDRVVGFMIYELHKNRIHVLNFAAAPEYRRQGVGSQMAAKLIAKLSPQRRTRVTLEVRETNLAAQLFFRENGFRAVSVLRNFYADSPEDAYMMQYRYRSEKEAVVATIPMDRVTRMAG